MNYATAPEFAEILGAGEVPLILLEPASGKVVDANCAAEEFYGWSVDEFKRRDLSVWDVSTSDIETTRETLSAIASGSLTRVLAHHRTARGGLRNVEIYCGPVRIAGAIYVYGIVHDLDERARAASTEEMLRAIVEQTIVGIYMIEDGRFAYVNPRMAELFGYQVGELTGKPAAELVDPEYRSLVARNIERRIRGEIDGLRYEFRGIRKDGLKIDVGVHGTVATVGGKRTIIGVMQDITARLKVEHAAQDYISRLERTTMGAVDALAGMVELRDPYTAGHQHRVGKLAAALGRELGQTEETIRGLEIAGYLHDIGKMNVPAEILTKPAKLSHPEFEIVKTHAFQGGAVLKNIDFPWPLAAVAEQHHERMDGLGYPHGLRGDAIAPEAKITAVADVVEAMASHRPYRAGLGMGPALLEIESHAGSKYDDAVAQACLRLFREKRHVLS